MPKTEIAEGAPAFYRDMQGKVHFVSREIGEKKVSAKSWVEISKEEAISSHDREHRETVGLPKGKK